MTGKTQTYDIIFEYRPSKHADVDEELLEKTINALLCDHGKVVSFERRRP
jgi:hypothetical protein